MLRHKQYRKLSGAAAMLSALAACKPQTLIKPTQGYIIGGNDIASLNDGNKGQVDAKVQHSSVLVATRLEGKKLKFCSGSLIAPERDGSAFRILTNHHCFAETGEDDKATPAPLGEACAFTKVYFDFTKDGAKSASTNSCAAGSLRSNFQGDLAVFELSAPPPANARPLELWSGEDSPAGRAAYIVHYPDVEDAMAQAPNGGPRLPTASVTFQNCVTTGPFDVSEWDLDRTLPIGLRHTCALIHGSSGSALVDRETNTILAVNWGGIKMQTKAGERIDNVGTKASYVQAFLNGTVESYLAVNAGRVGSLDASAGVDRSSGAKNDVRKSPGKALQCGVVDLSSRASVSLLLLATVFPVLMRSFAIKRRPR